MTTEKDLTLLKKSNKVTQNEQPPVTDDAMPISENKRRLQLRLRPADATRITRFTQAVGGSVSDFCSGLIESKFSIVDSLVREVVERLIDHDGWKTYYRTKPEEWTAYAQAFVELDTDCQLDALSDELHIQKGRLASLIVSRVINSEDPDRLRQYLEYWWPEDADIWWAIDKEVREETSRE